MSLLIGFLTFILVVNCLFLMLLVLIQLPKKEAGAGIAFGGAATDALFGAGSGNALTKVTKYSATLFVGMSVLLSVLNMHAAKSGTRRLEEEISKQAATAPARLAPALPPTSNVTARTAPTTTAPVTPAAPVTVTTNLLMSAGTNQAAPAASAVTAPAAPAKPSTGPTTTPEAPAPAPAK